MKKYKVLPLLRRRSFTIPRLKCSPQTMIMSCRHVLSFQPWHFVVFWWLFRSLPCGCFANTTPLLEEKSNLVAPTNLVDVLPPAFLHGAGPYAAFSAHDCPVDAGDLKFPEVFREARWIEI